MLGVHESTIREDLNAGNPAEQPDASEEDPVEDAGNPAVEGNPFEELYDVLVIDPPWPMKKIERNVRLVQHEFAYSVMSVEEIIAWDGATRRAAQDCHVFLWTTYKFFFDAKACLDSWGFKYYYFFTWHKPGGFQVTGQAQGNGEYCLYARKGSPEFIDTKAFPMVFYASRGEHSEKPEEFYAMLRRVTKGRRLDMFNRRVIEGFDGWGKETL